ncbi:L,D-transpeptidase family protein [Lacticaseibacillus zhaodongensis]|uniref:L,D-transpeptidase family protein n=1 Tax=Lacticaseibacillus zhaodongensis TaxID=2668065 RepID=UPI001E4193A1|nr:L,D-transpeptidase family protein [Lacticaseibacillus zhaodongensis]
MLAKRKNVLTLAIAIVVLLIIYVGGAIYYTGHFLPHTEVLGVSVSGKNVEDASQALQSDYKNHSYKLSENGKTLATASDAELGVKTDFTGALTKVKAQQSPWSWVFHLLSGQNSVQASVNAGINKAKLDAYAQSTATKLNQNRTAPVDASMHFADGKLVVNKEKSGNTIDVSKLQAALVSAIDTDNTTVQLQKVHEQPAVTTSSKAFTRKRDELSKIANITAQLKIENKTVTISKQELTSWLGYADGKVTVSKDGLTAYVAQLNKKYATYQKTRSFKSTKRGTVKIGGGIYGWSINSAAEVASLTSAIKAGKNFKKDIIHQGSGYNSNGTDIGSTYIEVDTQNQHEWYYKNGKLVMDSDVVTGKPDGHSTPTGVYYVWDKERNKTLTGKNADGSDYNSPVSYWMAVDYTGVGLHDAPWQPTFGGDWYKEHGSHGCVNNPPTFIAKLYPAVSLGTPVIII